MIDPLHIIVICEPYTPVIYKLWLSVTQINTVMKLDL